MVRTNSRDTERQAGSSLMDRDVTFRAWNRAFLVAVAGLAMTPAPVAPAAAHSMRNGAWSCRTLTVKSGETLELTETTKVSELTIADGGAIAAPDGCSLTLTVNGVEAALKLADLYDNDGIVTHIAAGTYRGDVVITVAAVNVITYNSRSWPIRQAGYIDANGIDKDRPGLSAVRGGRVRDTSANGLQLVSRGEAFNGVRGRRLVRGELPADPVRRQRPLRFHRLRGVRRRNRRGHRARRRRCGDRQPRCRPDWGIADAAATVLVKNSSIKVADGELPADYEDTGDTSAPIRTRTRTTSTRT